MINERNDDGKPPKKLNLDITGMHCQSCVTLITKKLQKLDGVKYCNVNFATEKASIEFDASAISENKIIDAVNSLGYTSKIITNEKSNIDHETQKRKKEIKQLRNLLIFSTLFAFPDFCYACAIYCWRRNI